jgi:hypothetical protein
MAAEYLDENDSDQEICSPLRDASARNNLQMPSLSQRRRRTAMRDCLKNEQASKGE